MDAGEKPGTVIRLEGDAVKQNAGQAIGPSAWIRRPDDHDAKAQGEPPREVVVIGVQPQSKEWTAELTTAVGNAMDQLITTVLAQLKTWRT